MRLDSRNELRAWCLLKKRRPRRTTSLTTDPPFHRPIAGRAQRQPSRRRTRPPLRENGQTRAIIHVHFSNRRRVGAGEHLHDRDGEDGPAQRRADLALDDLGLSAAAAPASNPECVREAFRRAREARIEACSLRSVLEATARDEVIDYMAQDVEKLLLASCDLIDTLSAYCIAHVCGV
jgi:hypothetical protein